jgi:hypothetical protein
MMTRASLVAIAVLFLYGAPAHALTPPTRVAPPGNAGATQYQEDVPSAAGAVPVTSVPSTPTTSQVLPHSVVTQLDHSGAAGRAVAQLANRTAPAAVGVPTSNAAKPTAGGAGGSHSGSHAGATSSVGSRLSAAVIGGGGGGLGLLLPAALAGSLIVAIAVVLARRRRTR